MVAAGAGEGGLRHVGGRHGQSRPGQAKGKQHAPGEQRTQPLAGKRVDEVNKIAELGTRLAHVDGGVPNIRISVPELNEYYIGQLIYFFEIACGISGLLEEVNPFNQPGVEAYKKNMFALLNKPGYEAESKAIQERLAKEK